MNVVAGCPLRFKSLVFSIFLAAISIVVLFVLPGRGGRVDYNEFVGMVVGTKNYYYNIVGVDACK